LVRAAPKPCTSVSAAGSSASGFVNYILLPVRTRLKLVVRGSPATNTLLHASF
jgi:hypothetical protein